jgi:hypothetical protein
VAAIIGAPPAARAANVALGKPAYATANNASAGNVDDGNFATSWNDTGSALAPADMVGVDLGSAKTIKFVKIYWAGQPTGFSIDVADSVDPTDPLNALWTNAYTRSSGDPQPTGADLIDLSSLNITGRNIRIYGTAPPSTTWGVTEFEVLDAALPTLSGTAKFGAAPVPNALITLVGPQGSAASGTLRVQADAAGKFSFPGLDAGAYSLVAFAPGQYAPVTTPVTIAAANVTQDAVFTQAATSSSAPLPAYSLDYVATATNMADQNATAGSLALPAEELPPGGAIWNSGTPLPTGGTLGAQMPKTLNFYIPPTADGKNNVISANGAIIPFPAAHYTAVYILQDALEGAYYTNATLHYADGSSAPVLTTSGSDLYQFTRGEPGTDVPATPGEDEIVALLVDQLYNANGSVVTETPGYALFMRTIPVDSTKVLSNITFGDPISGTGSNTLSKGVIYAWSGDSTDVPQAPGSVAGTVKAPNGSAVKGANVSYLSYKLVTGTDGKYAFSGVPAGSAVISANKPANYASKSITVTVGVGQAVTNADIQFTAAIPVVTDFLSSPMMDSVSTQANYSDFTITNWMLGREFIPTGLYSPDNPGANVESSTTFQHDPSAPSALAFNFGDIKDTPIAPGTVGYPAGGTPCSVIAAGAVFLAPPAKIFNVYFAEVGAEGGNNVAPILHYTDGSSETRVAQVSDWFGAPTPDELPYLIMRGRHNNTGQDNLGGTIRINALVVPVNPTKTLKDISFYQNSQPQTYPIILAVSFETDTVQPASSDVQVNVKTSGGQPAVGAIVTMGPYNTLSDATGTALFRGIPANLTVGIGAYLSGQTQQARVENHVIPVGQKLPSPDVVTLTLPAAAPSYTQLPLAYDYDVIATADMTGDFKGAPDDDYAWPAEAFAWASGSTVTVSGVPYLMPHKETGYNNVLRQNGQLIKVAPAHYSSLDVVATSQGAGNVSPRIYYVIFDYEDGSSEQVQFAAHDWFNDWTHPENTNRRLYFRTINPGASNPWYSPTRRNGAEDQTLDIAFLPEPIPVNAGKKLVSFQLVPIMRGVRDDDCSFLAMTLESNDTAAAGTVNGRVVGQPTGAAASGPIANVLVQYDAAHAAYTAADGTFSIASVPVGAGTLTVIPYGSGLLTKSFPVTVVSGANAAGDLNVGTPLTQIYSIMGAANVEQGLKQVEGFVTPYGYGYPASKTTVVTLAGKQGRQIPNGGRIHVQIDPGWLWHGRLGNAGLDISTLGNTTPKLAPHLYMAIEYFDNSSDQIQVQYNAMTTGTNGGNTYRMNSPFQNTAATSINRTSSNSWKTAILDFDPTKGDALGAYHGQMVQSDFRIVSSASSAVTIRSITLSLNPNPTLPLTPVDALRIVGGLAPASAADKTALDTNGDNHITIEDAVKFLRTQLGH